MILSKGCSFPMTMPLLTSVPQITSNRILVYRTKTETFTSIPIIIIALWGTLLLSVIPLEYKFSNRNEKLS